MFIKTLLKGGYIQNDCHLNVYHTLSLVTLWVLVLILCHLFVVFMLSRLQYDNHFTKSTSVLAIHGAHNLSKRCIVICSCHPFSKQLCQLKELDNFNGVLVPLRLLQEHYMFTSEGHMILIASYTTSRQSRSYGLTILYVILCLCLQRLGLLIVELNTMTMCESWFVRPKHNYFALSLTHASWS